MSVKIPMIGGQLLIAPMVAFMLAAAALTGCAGKPPPPPVATAPGAVSSVEAYLGKVSAKIREQRFLIKPLYGQAKEEQVEIGIIIDARGIALNYGLRSSSGSADVDRTILTMVARASPFPPPPADLLKDNQVGLRIAMNLPKTRKEWGEAFD
jgi:TonB family protein